MSSSLRPHGLYSPWNSPVQNTEVGSRSLLQDIFPAQGLNPGLPHCRQTLYRLSHQGSPNQLSMSPLTSLLPFLLWIPHSSAGISWDQPPHQLLAVDFCSLGQLLEEPILRDLPPSLLITWQNLVQTLMSEMIQRINPRAGDGWGAGRAQTHPLEVPERLTSAHPP